MYALIHGDKVVDVTVAKFPVHPDFIWVDCGGIPDVAHGWGYEGGSLVPPAEPEPSLSQRAQVALVSGLTVNLSGSASISATYPTDPGSTQKLGSLAAAIAVLGGFPGGISEMPMKDVLGVWHSLTLPQWKAIVAALASYVATLELIIDGNPLGVTELPSATIAIEA